MDIDSSRSLREPILLIHRPNSWFKKKQVDSFFHATMSRLKQVVLNLQKLKKKI